MSGGSHNHIYSNIEWELCGKMHDIELNDLMKDIVKLTHDLEWYDSGDKSSEDYQKTVSEFKRKWFEQPRKNRLIKYVDEEIEKTKNNLYDLINNKILEDDTADV